MTTKCTPGPWEVRKHSYGTVRDAEGIFRVGEKTPLIDGVWGRNLSEADANARLIAAAPELLAALQELREQLRQHVKLDVKKHYSLMVADAAAGTAIAKATGEQK